MYKKGFSKIIMPEGRNEINMKNLTVKDIIEQTKGELIIGDENLEIKAYSKDTRQINEKDCYIGIKGKNFDGNLFWKQALEKGADAVIIENLEITEEEKEQFKGKTIIKVPDTLEALYKMASYKRSLYDIPVIAITGSVGKTSTKDIVANVVSKKYKTLKTIGNNNNNIGMPLTILRLQDEEAIVLEMGMDHLGEISLLSKIAKPTICVITNIGTSHIVTLGSQENILKAKLEILDGAKNPTVIINHDDKLLKKWYEENKNKYNIVKYGIEQTSEIMAETIKSTAENSTFTCNNGEKKINIKVPVGGTHFVLNSLCAVTVGKVLQIEDNYIKEGIETFELTKRRMDITNLKNGTKIINDAYNANYESMIASIKVLKSYEENRKIAVLGDMLNLGNFSEKLHREVGKEIAKNSIDILICQGNESKFIADEAKNQGMQKDKIFEVKEKEQILEILEKVNEPKDVILFKASNALKFFEIAEKYTCK